MRRHRLLVGLFAVGVVLACGGSTSLDDTNACGPHATKCGDTCSDIQWDPTNCGACGNICGATQLCVEGICGTQCLGGTTQCGSSCVNLDSEPTHCGACDVACAPAVACFAGKCLGGCTSDTTKCGAVCTHLQTDPNNCGKCGNVCSSGLSCVSGACVCGAGETLCQGGCVDESSDPNHCGNCGVACGVNEACVGGACQCASGFTKCGLKCIDTQASHGNCGACSNACPDGEICTTGTCASPTNAWHMFGNDAQHSGYNALETAGPPLSAAWTDDLAPINQTPEALHPVVVEDGLVFVTQDSYFASSSSLLALHLDDGSPAWNYDFGSVFSVGHPAVVDGVVYLGNGQGTQFPPPQMWAFHSLSGIAAWQSTFGAQWEHYYAPLVTNDYVYADTGAYGGIAAFSVADGTQKFFDGTIGQYDEWSPALFDGDVFTFIAGDFRAHDPLTGALLWSVVVNWNWNGYSMKTAPVFDANYGYIISPPTLYAIDPVARGVAWQASGGYTGAPAVADGVVYGTSAGNLIARDAATGLILWTFTGDGGLSYPAAIASGTIYVASDANVYAVDIATHAQVWSAGVGGWLAIASKRLLVASKDGKLHAYVMSE